MQPQGVMFFLLLAELAIGGALLVVLVDYEGVATKGFLGLAAATYLVLGLGAWWVRSQLVLAPDGSGLAVDARWQSTEGIGLAVFLVALAAYMVLQFGTDRRLPRLAGAVAAAGGLTSLVASGLVYHLAHLGGISTVVSVVSGAVVLGAAMGGMILGHWYLVTPGLSPRPVQTMTWALLAALGVQTVAIVTYLVIGSGLELEALLGGLHPVSIAFWLRVLAGVVLPVGIGWMTLQCCKIRSLQSATGLLYVAVALVLAGEIMAKLLLVLAGVPL